MTDTLEETAQQIADRGREALIARLRPAFEEAAAAHSDVLDLAPEQLDAMVQRAVERADGLQWRRALASVATELLGISLGEALGHPAVVRAQELAGAPSYEDSLAQLGPLPGVSAEPAGPADAYPATEADPAPVSQAEETDHGDEPMTAVEDAGTLVPAPPSDAEQAEAAAQPSEAEADADASKPAAEPELPLATAEYETVGAFADEEEYEDEDALRVAVIHLGGIANLAPAERNIELQMSEDGLDIVRGGGEILGRLDWDQVTALEVPAPRGRRRMRRGTSTHLIVRTARGDASFEVPEVSPPELQQHLAPIVARHVRGG